MFNLRSSLAQTISRRIVATLLLSMISFVPSAWWNIGTPKASAVTLSAAACPNVDNTNGTLSGPTANGQYTCTYANLPSITGALNIPAGTSVSVTLVGGAGGGGGADAGTAGAAGGAGATVTTTFTATSGGITICVGGGGGGGADYAGVGGAGSGGVHGCTNNGYNGGAGGNAGGYGSSGAGGGGGAATVVYTRVGTTNTLVAVAGGGGGGAGGSGRGTLNTPGNQAAGGSGTTSGTAGGNANTGSSAYIDDGSGGGGGGGGVAGGSGGAKTAGSGTNEGYAAGGNYGTSTPSVSLSTGGGGAGGTSGGSGSAGAAGSVGLSFSGPAITTAPTTNGSSAAYVGTALTVTAGTVTSSNGSTTTYYQWMKQTSCTGSFTDISGQTNSSYTPTSSDIGSCFEVKQIVTDATYDSGGGGSTLQAVRISASTVAVAKAPQTITMGSLTSLKYYETATLTATGYTGSGTITYSATGSCSISGTTITATASSGSCSVSATIAADASNAQATSSSISVTLSKAILTVTPDAQSVLYGGSSPTYTFSVTGFKNSETTSTAASYVAPSCTSTYTNTTSAASSPVSITCSGGSATNYSFTTTATANLTIGKTTPTTTLTVPSLTYGSAATLSATASVAGSFIFKVDSATVTSCSSVSTPTTSPFTSTCSYTPSDVSAHTFTVDFNPTSTANYNSLTAQNSTSATPSKAEQAPNILTSTVGYFGVPLYLTATGGSSTGPYRFGFNSFDGTATGCGIQGGNTSPNAYLLPTSVGTCDISVQRDGLDYYFTGPAGYHAFVTILPAPLETPTVTATATSGTAKSISVSWNAVTNATSYTLKLYDDSNNLLSTTGLTGLTGTSTTITSSNYGSFTNNTYYRVSVTAVGTGNYSDSMESTKARVLPNNSASSITNIINPVDISYTDGQVASFYATGSGNGTITYQWQRTTDSGANWGNIMIGAFPTAGTETFTVTSDPFDTVTGYKFRLVITNTLNGTSTSYTTTAATLTVSPAISLNNPSNQTIKYNAGAFSLQISASGGAGPLVYAVNQGSLPNGVSLNSTGLISGTPTVVGDFTGIVISVTDANGSTQFTNAFTISVTLGDNQLTISPSMSSLTFGASPITLSATGRGSGAISFSTSSTTVCSISGSTLTILGVGTCTFNTTQQADSRFSAISADTSFTVSASQLSTPTNRSSVASANSTTSIDVSFTKAAHAYGTFIGVFSDANHSSQVTYTFVTGETATITGLSPATTYYVFFLSKACDPTGQVTCSNNYSDSDVTSTGIAVTTHAAAGSISITQDLPATASKTDGQSLILHATASANGTLSYQWQRKQSSGSWANIAGGISETLTITTGGYSDQDQFRVVITNSSYGTSTTATSGATTLTLASALSINDVGNQSTRYGTGVNLEFIASGGLAPYTYTVTSGTLPSGAVLQNEPDPNLNNVDVGRILWTAQSIETQTGIVVSVTDANGYTVGSVPFSITIQKGINTITGFGGTIYGLLYQGSAVDLTTLMTQIQTTSGLPITYTATKSAANTTIGRGASTACHIVGTLVYPDQGGQRCYIRANQAGDDHWLAATEVISYGDVGSIAQPTVSASMSPTTNVFTGTALQGSVTVSVSGGSNETGDYSVATGAPSMLNPVDYSTITNTASNCHIGSTSSTAISITNGSYNVYADSVGSCFFLVTKPGNSNWGIGVASVIEYKITKATPVLTITSTPTSTRYGDTYTVTTSSTGSTSPVVITIDTATASTCSISGSVVTFNGVGTCTINVNQAGDSNYLAASQVNQSLTISQASQPTPVFSLSPNSASYNGSAYSATITITTSTTNFGAATYSISNGTASSCSLNSTSNPTTISASTAGTCLISVTYAGDTNHQSSTSSNVTFTFSRAVFSTPTGLSATKQTNLPKQFDITWNAVTNATTYQLVMYSGSTPIDTMTVSGTSRAVTTTDYNIVSGATYGFSVQAMAEGEYDSSSVSSVVTISAWAAPVNPTNFSSNLAKFKYTVGQTISFTETATVTDGGSVSYGYQIYLGAGGWTGILGSSSSQLKSITNLLTNWTQVQFCAQNSLHGMTSLWYCGGGVNITISPAIVYNAPSTGLTGTVGTAFSLSTSASGGSSTSYTYAVSSGSLPNGLSINPSTGAITGTPTAIETQTVTLSATDTNTATVSTSAFTIVVNAGAAVNPTFGTITKASGGFTAVISNYSANYTYGLSDALGGTLSRSGNTVTVSGLGDNVTDTLTVTAARSGYLTGSASTTGTSLLAPLTPILSIYSRTTTGIQIKIDNFATESFGSWVITGSGTVSGTLTPDVNGVITVNLSAGQAETVTVTVSNSTKYRGSGTAFIATTAQAQSTMSFALLGGGTNIYYNTPVTIVATVSAPGTVQFTNSSGSSLSGCSAVPVDTATLTARCIYTPGTFSGSLYTGSLSLAGVLTPTDPYWSTLYAYLYSAMWLNLTQTFATLDKPVVSSANVTSSVAATISYTHDTRLLSTTLSANPTSICLYTSATGGTCVSSTTTSLTSFNLSNLTPGTDYWVTVQNTIGNEYNWGYLSSAVSDRFKFTTLPGPALPNITQQPVNVGVDSGMRFTLSFEYTLSDSSTATIQWFRSPTNTALAAYSTSYSETNTVTSTTSYSLYAKITASLNGSTIVATTNVATATVYKAITISNPTTLTGSVGALYSQQISSSYGSGGNVFTSSGTLPPGITLSTGGLLSGTPTAAGSFSGISITVTDTATGSATTSLFTLTISQGTQTPLVITTTSGTYPAMDLNATGGSGTGAISFALVDTRTVSASAGVQIGTTSSTSTVKSSVVSADGKTLYVVDSGSTSIFVYDTVAKTSSTISTGLASNLFKIAIAPNGNYLVVTNKSTSIYIYNLLTSTGSSVAISGLASSGPVVISPDSLNIYVADFNSYASANYRNSKVYKLDSSGAVVTSWIVDGSGAPKTSIAINSQGTYIYVGVNAIMLSQYGSVYQIGTNEPANVNSLDASHKFGLTKQGASLPSHIGISPDNKYLIATGQEDTNQSPYTPTYYGYYWVITINQATFSSSTGGTIAYSVGAQYYYPTGVTMSSDSNYAYIQTADSNSPSYKVTLASPANISSTSKYVSITGATSPTLVQSPKATVAYLSYSNSSSQVLVSEVVTIATQGSAGCSISGSTLSAISAGTCNVQATKAADSNYLIANSPNTVITISAAAAPTVTAFSKTVNYTGQAISDTVTVTGLVGSDSATALGTTFTYVGTSLTNYNSTAPPSQSDTYTVTPSAGWLYFTTGSQFAYLKPYNYVTGTLVINTPPPVFLTASTATITKSYGSAQGTSLLTVSGGTGAISLSYASTYNGSASANPSQIVIDTSTLSTLGTATLKVNDPRVGVWSLTVTATDSVGITASSVITVTITQVPTSISFTNTNFVLNQSGTFTATVSESSTATVTGTVTFASNGTTLCTTSTFTSQGVATCNWTPGDRNTYLVTASFTDTSTSFADSNSGTPISITPDKATLSLAAANSGSTSAGGSATLTGTLTGFASLAPTGTVTFTYQGNTLCTASSFTAGVTTCSWTITGSGTQLLTATYSGDNNYNGAMGTTSITVSQCSVTSSGLTYGTSTPSAGYCVVRFTAGTGTWTTTSSSYSIQNATTLVVGGGGGGANRGLSGGSAGGLYLGNVALSSYATPTVTVGAGGAGLTTSAANNTVGNNGANSVFASITENGGAGGSAATPVSGAGSINGVSYAAKAAGAISYLNNNVAGGGGGGSTGTGSAASSTTSAGAGGAGYSSNLSGTNLCYAAGGGGGYGELTGTAGAAGTCTGTTTTAGAGSNVYTSASGSATANSGSGGGGGSFYLNSNGATGAGGSGVVIAKFLSPTVMTVSSNFTVTAGNSVTLVETASVFTFTRTITWQYSYDTGTTWTQILSTNTNGAPSGTCNTSSCTVTIHYSDSSSSHPTQLFRAVISDTDGTLTTISYSPSITATVNPLNATKLYVANTIGVPSSSLTLSTYGGPAAAGATGTTYTYTVAAGTASGCSISSSSLTTTSAGTCFVRIKAFHVDYAIYQSDTTTITFVVYQVNIPAPVVAPPNSPVIGGQVAAQTSNTPVAPVAVAPSIASLSITTAHPSDSVIITGIALSSVDYILLGRSINITVGSLTVVTSSDGNSDTVTFSVPSATTAGAYPISVHTPNGQSRERPILTVVVP